MNKVVLVGRIVRPIEVKTVGPNRRVCNNVLAVQRHHKDANGERVADFIPFVAWNHSAELIERYCQKGDQLSISGRMQSRKYMNKDEQDVYVVECIVEEVTLIYTNGDYSQSPSESTETLEQPISAS